jgi:uncharacterized protein (TIGR02246 family)
MGRGIGIVLALVVVVAGAAVFWMQRQPSAQPAPDIRVDEAAIRQATTQWAASIPAKDVAKFVSFYAPDAAVYPFGAPRVTGADNIRKYWSDFLTSPNFVSGSVTPATIEVAASGDLAWETGTFALEMKDARGKPATTTGKYVVVWKKQPGGQWKAVADIFNTDQ